MSQISPQSEVNEIFTKKCPHLTQEPARVLFDRIQIQCPFWIRKLIELRSTLLKPFGFSEIKWENFTCIEETHDRLHFSFKDKFFSSNLIFEINRNSRNITLTNSLRFTGNIGRLYFKLTSPIHKRILKELLDCI